MAQGCARTELDWAGVGLDWARLSLNTDWSGAGMEPGKSRGRGRSRGPEQNLGQEQG